MDFHLSTNTHTQNWTTSSSTTIDNIFTHCTRFKNIDIKPIINGMSDHDAQLLMIYKSNIKCSSKAIYKQRQINYTSLTYFTYNLNSEVWDEIFVNKE